MKLPLRISVLTLVIAAGFVANSLPASPAANAIHQSSVPGPTPYCNPFTKKCPPIR